MLVCVVLLVVLWPDAGLSQPRPVELVEPLALSVEERGERITTSVELPGASPEAPLLVELSGRFTLSADPSLPSGLWTARTGDDGLSLRRIHSTREAQGLDEVADYNGLRWQTGLPGGDVLISCSDGRFGLPVNTTTNHLQLRTRPQAAGPTRFRVDPLRGAEYAAGAPHWVGRGELRWDATAEVGLGVAAASASVHDEGRGCVLVSVRRDGAGRWRWSRRALLDASYGWLADWAVSADARRAYVALISPPTDLGMWSVPDRLVAVDLDDGTVEELSTGLDETLGISLSPDGATLAVYRAWTPESDPADRLRNIYARDLAEDVRRRRLEARSDERVLIDVASGAVVGADTWRWTPRPGTLGRIAEGQRAYRLREDGVERTLARIVSPLIEAAAESYGGPVRPFWYGPTWSPDGARLALQFDLAEGHAEFSDPILVLDLREQTFVVVQTKGGVFAWTSADTATD